MLSFQIAELIEEVSKEIHPDNAFIHAVRVLSEVVTGISEDVAAIGTNSNNAAYANSIQGRLRSTKEYSAVISPRAFYVELLQLEGALKKFQAQLPSPSGYVESLIESLDSFAVLFDNYLKNQTGDNAAPLVLSAPNVAQRLIDFRDSVNLFHGILESASPQRSDSSTLSVVLSGEFDLKEFISRIQAIESMYSELCQLLNISQIDHPLQIEKIESGSLLAKVAGSAFVIGLMTQFIESSVSYVHAHYTAEGQIKSIPAKVESLDKVIEMTQKLKEAGYDTSAMEIHVAKSAHAIAGNLNTLIEGQPSIILNGLELTVTDQKAGRQLGGRVVPKLSRRAEN